MGVVILLCLSIPEAQLHLWALALFGLAGILARASWEVEDHENIPMTITRCSECAWKVSPPRHGSGEWCSFVM